MSSRYEAANKGAVSHELLRHGFCFEEGSLCHAALLGSNSSRNYSTGDKVPHSVDKTLLHALLHTLLYALLHTIMKTALFSFTYDSIQKFTHNPNLSSIFRNPILKKSVIVRYRRHELQRFVHMLNFYS